MMATALACSEVIGAALAIPLEDLEEYARTARAQVQRTEALAPVLAWEHSLGDLQAMNTANRAAARAATALAEFRRVLEEVRARG